MVPLYQYIKPWRPLHPPNNNQKTKTPQFISIQISFLPIDPTGRWRQCNKSEYGNVSFFRMEVDYALWLLVCVCVTDCITVFGII